MKGPQRYSHHQLDGMGTVWVYKGPSPDEPFVWFQNEKGGDKWGCIPVEEFWTLKHKARFE